MNLQSSNLKPSALQTELSSLVTEECNISLYLLITNSNLSIQKVIFYMNYLEIMKYAFMQNQLISIQFFAKILNSFIISHLLELLKVRLLLTSIMVAFDQCGTFLEITKSQSMLSNIRRYMKLGNQFSASLSITHFDS